MNPAPQGSTPESAGEKEPIDFNSLEWAIERLETVAFRIRQTLMGKDWTRREPDAQIIEDEVIPIIRKHSGQKEAQAATTVKGQKELWDAIERGENHDQDDTNPPQDEADCFCVRCCAIRLLRELAPSVPSGNEEHQALDPQPGHFIKCSWCGNLNDVNQSVRETGGQP